ncbi:hypothetical protein T492DRAFT_1141525 [Pavlovales sp. CCMP2436]|nr:hypothetical protein T492DRAFT_1141525 [Pavlovales sp. CCMP2436]
MRLLLSLVLLFGFAVAGVLAAPLGDAAVVLTAAASAAANRRRADLACGPRDFGLNKGCAQRRPAVRARRAPHPVRSSVPGDQGAVLFADSRAQSRPVRTHESRLLREPGRHAYPIHPTPLSSPRRQITMFRSFILLLCVLASATAFSGPVAVQMSMGRREAFAVALGGLAVLAAAPNAEAGLPEFVRCPAPEGTCDAWKKGKAASPTFAQIRDKSPFYNKDKMMNSIPKVKGVILQSTLYTPK